MFKWNGDNHVLNITKGIHLMGIQIYKVDINFYLIKLKWISFSEIVKRLTTECGTHILNWLKWELQTVFNYNMFTILVARRN